MKNSTAKVLRIFVATFLTATLFGGCTGMDSETTEMLMVHPLDDCAAGRDCETSAVCTADGPCLDIARGWIDNHFDSATLEHMKQRSERAHFERFNEQDAEPECHGEVIEFADHVLGMLIRETLSLPENASILCEDLLSMARLSTKGHEVVIQDLSGLERATNLVELRLSNQAIVDISPLKDLYKLEKLSLDWNEINDLSPLANLVGLQQLSVSGNNIVDITPLTNLVNIEELLLGHNQLRDLSPLKHLERLSILQLSFNEIDDIQPLGNLENLSFFLDLSHNSIVDIAPLSSLENLENLWLFNNHISDLSSLISMASLKSLDLRVNQIHDISPLLQLQNLSWLQLDANCIDFDDSEVIGLLDALFYGGVNVNQGTQKSCF